MARILIYCALSIGLIVVAVIAIGAALPVAHVAARRISLHRSPAEVFALISDFQSASNWRRGVKQVTLLPVAQGRQKFLEVGDHDSITMEVWESNGPGRLVTAIADKSLPYGGSWIFEVSPTPEGCILQITERGEVYNPFFRFVSRFVLGYKKTMNDYLSDVAKHFGEKVQPSDATPSNP